MTKGDVVAGTGIATGAAKKSKTVVNCFKALMSLLAGYDRHNPRRGIRKLLAAMRLEFCPFNNPRNTIFVDKTYPPAWSAISIFRGKIRHFFALAGATGGGVMAIRATFGVVMRTKPCSSSKGLVRGKGAQSEPRPRRFSAKFSKS